MIEAELKFGLGTRIDANGDLSMRTRYFKFGFFPYLLLGGMVALAACTQSTNSTGQPEIVKQSEQSSPSDDKAKAYFAGGCFWCTESDFEKLPGVYEAISGYTGGDLENPTYKQVSYTETGHYEAVEVIYDPALISYRALVDFHFRHIDPTDDGGQFCDRGSSYKTAIFVQNPQERKDAEASKIAAQTKLDQEIVTPVIAFKKFWVAEDYHQDYYKTAPVRYKYYRASCGRDRRIAQLWGELETE